jgi:hypothetical protein
VTVSLLPGVLLAVAADGPLEHDPHDVRSRAQELLSRPPYAVEDPGLVDRTLQAVGERIAEFVRTLLGVMSGDALVAWVIVAVGALLLGLVVWRATRGATVDRSVGEVAPGASTRSASEWHELADRHAAAGELVEALRCRYAALVAALMESGTIEDVPGRTVRELDAEVAVGNPGLADDVAAAGRRIEAVVYGRETVTRGDLEVVTTAAQAAGPSRVRGSSVSLVRA